MIENLVPRWVEIQYALTHISQHPILGIGLYTPYRPPIFQGDTNTTYMHNAYVWIWLRTGLLGLISFLWVLFRYLVDGLQFGQEIKKHFFRSVALGFTIAYLAMAISNLVAPTFVQGLSLAIYGVILGVIELNCVNLRNFPNNRTSPVICDMR